MAPHDRLARNCKAQWRRQSPVQRIQARCLLRDLVFDTTSTLRASVTGRFFIASAVKSSWVLVRVLVGFQIRNSIYALNPTRTRTSTRSISPHWLCKSHSWRVLVGFLLCVNYIVKEQPIRLHCTGYANRNGSVPDHGAAKFPEYSFWKLPGDSLPMVSLVVSNLPTLSHGRRPPMLTGVSDGTSPHAVAHLQQHWRGRPHKNRTRRL